MRVLVLSIPTGGGHYSTGAAIEKKLNELGAEARLVDVYKYVSPILGEGVSRGYIISTKYVPEVYGHEYRKYEKRNHNNHNFPLLKTFNYMLSYEFAPCVREFDPDVIVCTHVLSVLVVDALRKRKKIDERVKTVGIVTDFTVHPYWEVTGTDYFVTASELLNYQFEKKGIAVEKLLPFGIPIDEKFSVSKEKVQARKELNIADKMTVLVMTGSMGYGHILKHIKCLDKLDMDFQMLIVCGNNKRMYAKAARLDTVHKKYVYGFSREINTMMDASDCLVTKPGGLTVSEALAKGMPMILFNPIPGQEDRNLEFLLNNGLAQYVTDTYPIDEAVYQLFSNEWKRENLSKGVKYIGKADAAQKLCEFILGLEQ